MHPYGKQILFAYILYHGFSSANHSVNTLRDTCHKYDIAFVCINAFIVHNKAKRAIAQLNCRLTQSLLLSWTVNRLAGVASFSGRPVRGAEGCAWKTEAAPTRTHTLTCKVEDTESLMACFLA